MTEQITSLTRVRSRRNKEADAESSASVPSYAVHDPLLSVQDVSEYLSIGVPTVWDYAKADPDFPKPIKLTARCTRWRKSALNAWIALKEREAG